MTDCGGCQGLGSHRRHCKQNPDYSREREWADQAEDLGDMVGPNCMGAANALYRAAGLLRDQADVMQAKATEDG
jgi:hypothetical protein